MSEQSQTPQADRDEYLYKRALAYAHLALEKKRAGRPASERRPYQRRAWELYEAAREAGEIEAPEGV